MNNRKLAKVLITVLCFAMIATISASAYAAVTIANVNVNPDTSGNASQSATSLGNKVIGVIQVVGILLSVGVLMVLGIKYMMGSAEEKAEYKKTFVPYLIGAIILFAAAAFAKTLYGLANAAAANNIIAPIKFHCLFVELNHKVSLQMLLLQIAWLLLLSKVQMFFCILLFLLHYPSCI